MGSIVIIGAGLAGVRVAEQLRNAGCDDAITLIGDEARAPYDRPPLSKAVLTGDRDLVELKASQWYADNAIGLRVGVAVTAIDPQTHAVTIDTGEVVSYTTLIIATGLRARHLPDSYIDGAPVGLTIAEIGGMHVLRTADDVDALRAQVTPGTRVAVIGAGFIGCEVAASAQTMGAHVTIIEPLPQVLYAALGSTIGARVAALHTDRGVVVRTGVGVERILTEKGKVIGVRCSDGSLVEADVIVQGIGASPATELAVNAGIIIADSGYGGGISCDAHGRTSQPDIYAIGDVANFANTDGSRGRRVEHWNHVVAQAKTVASAIMGSGGESAVVSVEYFWTDQFDKKIQCVGTPSADDEVHVIDDDGSAFIAYYSRDGVLTAVVGSGRAGAVMKMRTAVAAGTPIAELLDAT